MSFTNLTSVICHGNELIFTLVLICVIGLFIYLPLSISHYIDIDECLEADPCPHSGECVNRLGTHICLPLVHLLSAPAALSLMGGDNVSLSLTFEPETILGQEQSTHLDISGGAGAFSLNIYELMFTDGMNHVYHIGHSLPILSFFLFFLFFLYLLLSLISCLKN